MYQVQFLPEASGVGENAAEVRTAVCAKLGFVRLELDPQKNCQPSSDQDRDVATSESLVRVLIVRVQEDWAIARACWQLRQLDKV